jgi:hypothetical protein
MADAKLKLGDSTPQHILLHIDSKLADRIFFASPDCSDLKKIGSEPQFFTVT